MIPLRLHEKEGGNESVAGAVDRSCCMTGRAVAAEAADSMTVGQGPLAAQHLAYLRERQQKVKSRLALLRTRSAETRLPGEEQCLASLSVLAAP